MNDQAMRFRFGVFVLAALILLAILTLLFGGFPAIFKRTDSYTIVFSNIHGVAPGTPVRRSGVNIGEVRSVELENETGKVRVGIRVDRQYFLRKGDRPTIVQGLLGGDASIAFVPPEAGKEFDKTPVEPGAVLEGATPSDAGVLMRKAGDLLDPAQEALIELRNVMRRMDKMGPTFEESLKDLRELSKDLRDVSKVAREMAPELQKTNEEFRSLVKPTRETLAEVQATARYWGKVGERTDLLLKTNEDKIVKSIERAEESLRRLNELLSDENQKYVRETLKNVRNGSQQLESISNDTSMLLKESRVTMKQVTETMKRAEDAIIDMQKTMKPFGDRGPAMFKNMEESADNLNKTLKDLRDLMQIVARSDGTISKLISDPSLYNNLNDSAEMVTKILPRLDRVMRDVEIFADKLARHPELIGLGGIIRPSSGLKEAPSVIPYRVIPTGPPHSVIPYRIREWQH
jgi:phospholipid/cholesterol/gamma-HCH transport system substrate-binding protein